MIEQINKQYIVFSNDVVNCGRKVTNERKINHRKIVFSYDLINIRWKD